MFVNFKVKMKKKKVALARWSKESFGDIFQPLAIREELVKVKELFF